MENYYRCYSIGLDDHQYMYVYTLVCIDGLPWDDVN